MSDIPIPSPDYAAWLSDVKSRIQSARISAARAVNRELILLYWDIGHGIVEKHEEFGWGESVVERLAFDLKAAFPNHQGFSPSNLWRRHQFYRVFTAPEILAQAVRELVALIPWGHHVAMLPKMKSPDEHFYYLTATAQFGWTRAVLLNQIKANAYQRSLAEGKSHNFPLALPEHLAEQAEEALAGKKEYFIDLLFYHRFLKCLVAVELKIGEFEPEFAAKMDFYLNLLNYKERAPDDNPSIGIILCAEKDDVEVEFALKSKANPIGVAEYQLKPTLPKELKGKLPSAKELGEAIGLPAKGAKKKRRIP